MVKAIEPPEKGDLFVRDSEIVGFGLKITAAGSKSYIFERRINGRPKRIKIGNVADLTVEKARKEAEKLAGEIATGEDPVAKKKAARAVSLTLREALTNILPITTNLRIVRARTTGR